MLIELFLGREPASKFGLIFQTQNDRIVHTGKFNWTYVLVRDSWILLLWVKQSLSMKEKMMLMRMD